jgi:RNA polymerase sigma factor FliA
MAGTSSPAPSSAPSTDTAARWAHRQSPAQRAALVDAYTPLVRRIAARCFLRRIGNELEFADFLQFGHIGLLEAIDRYSPARGVRFETFATYRIEGAMLNGVTSLSEYQRQASVRRGLLGQRTASLASGGDEPAAETSQDPLERLAEVAIGLALGFALEDAALYVDGDRIGPDNAYTRLELHQLRQQVAQLLQQLPETEQLVLHRHYYQQVPFEETARVLGLTKGRVSQIHQAALKRLRTLVKEVRGLDVAG